MPAGDRLQGKAAGKLEETDSSLSWVQAVVASGGLSSRTPAASDGTVHTKQTHRYADGSIYEGEFKFGKMEGRGCYVFGKWSQFAGDRYEGEYKASKMTGHGRYTWATRGPSGSASILDWKDASRLPRGGGTLLWP